jgi:hypothetical protein
MNSMTAGCASPPGFGTGALALPGRLVTVMRHVTGAPAIDGHQASRGAPNAQAACHEALSAFSIGPDPASHAIPSSRPEK